MKSLITTILILFACNIYGQTTLVAHGNTLWLKNTLTNDSSKVVTERKLTDSLGAVRTTVIPSTRLADSLAANRLWSSSTYSPIAHTHTGVYQPVGSYLVAADITGKLNKTDTAAMLSAYQTAINGKQAAGTYATGTGTASGTNTGDNATNSQYSSDYRAANFVAGTNYQVPITAGDVTTSGATSTIGALKVTNGMLAGSIDLTTKVTGILPSANGGTGNGFFKISGPATSEKTFTVPNANSTLVGKVAQVDIAARSTAVTTTTIFTPSASGMYRLSIYLKLSATGTSPVAGPVTITYTDADGSVAQSHVMLLQSVTGSVVTTTVNNSTTTGTVNGSMIFNAKTGVAIQYAVAVSGTFGAGTYVGHITLEAL